MVHFSAKFHRGMKLHTPKHCNSIIVLPLSFNVEKYPKRKINLAFTFNNINGLFRQNLYIAFSTCPTNLIGLGRSREGQG